MALSPSEWFDPRSRRSWLLMPLAAALLAGIATSAPSPWPLVLLGVVGIAGLGRLAWRHPVLAGGLVPVLMPPPQFLSVFAHELALALTATLVFAAGWRGRRRWLHTLDPIEVLAWGFLAWGFVSILWGDSAWWWLFAMRKYGIGVLALWTAWRLARMDRGGWDLLTGIALAAVALSSVALVKSVSTGMLTAGMDFSRRDGTDLGWGTSNYIGALLVMMLPCSLHVALRAPQLWRRLVGWAVLPLAALFMAVAASRGGALLMVGIAMVFLFRERIGPRTVVLGIGFLGALVLLLLGPGSSLFLSRFTDAREIGSLLVRLFLAREGLRRIPDHFPFGMGLGQGVAQDDHLGVSSPHNFAITLTYETGVLGLLLFGAWVVSIWRRGWRLRRDPRVGPIAVTLLFTLATGVLNSLFEPTIEGLHGQFLFYWVLGALLGRLSPDEHEAVTPAPGPASA